MEKSALVIIDFDGDDDMIDLRGMGVTYANFEEKVSFETGSTGTTVRIGDMSMMLLGEDDLSIDEFLLEDDASAKVGSMDDQSYQMALDYPADYASSELYIEDTMRQHYANDASVNM